MVLKKTVDYIRIQLEERRMLTEEGKSLGVVTEEVLKGQAPRAGSTGLGSRGTGWGQGSI